MARNPAVPKESIGRSSRTDGDRKEIGNLILLFLPSQECTRVLASPERVRLKLHQVLHDAGEVIKSVSFMNSGLGPVLTVQPDGKSVEIGLIGEEGFVGVPAVFGFKTNPLRVVVQADATSYRMDVQTLRKLLPERLVLNQRLQAFAMVLSMQSTQLDGECQRCENLRENWAQQPRETSLPDKDERNRERSVQA